MVFCTEVSVLGMKFLGAAEQTLGKAETANPKLRLNPETLQYGTLKP